jgi:hypothetical protein
MRHRLITSALSISIALVSIGSLAAPEVAAACTGTSITVYANDSGGVGTRWCSSGGDITNLGSKASSQCLPFPSWNDCISRVTVDIVSGSSGGVCLWNDAGYSGSGLRFIDDRTNYLLGSPWDNNTSSIEWGLNCLTD